MSNSCSATRIDSQRIIAAPLTGPFIRLRDALQRLAAWTRIGLRPGLGLSREIPIGVQALPLTGGVTGCS
ncbi:MAG: hypothetical protein U5K38_05565 [Woeseiaceae bacterium]|nr:hypothetical protein [Woeseiaceae bacterium]